MYIYIYIYLCIAYISSHSKGPEQDQLRSPFVPYVRNTAERSIHNFDSGPNDLPSAVTSLLGQDCDPVVGEESQAACRTKLQETRRRMTVAMGQNSTQAEDFLPSPRVYPLVNIQKAIESGHL